MCLNCQRGTRWSWSRRGWRCGSALLALPPGKRVMLVLRYLEDLPEGQVADILGCSVGTVRSQTHKAIAQLRSVLPSPGQASTEVSK